MPLNCFAMQNFALASATPAQPAHTARHRLDHV